MVGYRHQRYSLRIPPLQTLFGVLKGGVFLKNFDIAFEGGVSLEIFIQKTPNILNSINLFFFLGFSPSQKFLFSKFIKFLNLVPRKSRKYNYITKYTVENRNYAER